MAVVPKKINQNFTNNFLLRNQIKIWRIWLSLKVHDSRFEVVHVKAVNNLIVLAVSGWTDINNFPIQGSWKLGKALESYVKLERCQYISWVISDNDVVNMNLGHYGLFSRFALYYYYFTSNLYSFFTLINFTFYFLAEIYSAYFKVNKRN